MIEHSGVICIDVDGKDNTHVSNFQDLKKLISQIPYVAYCGLSVGGKGYFILIPVKYPNKHREQFKACCEDFERCGIVVDHSCINISRLRFMSYDSEAYFNENATIYTRIYEEKKEAPKYNKVYDSNAGNDIEKLISEIQSRCIDITGSYQQWLEIGAAIASEFGESGRSYFHAVSQYSTKYNQKATDRKYTDVMKMRNFNISTLFYYAKQYGIMIHEKRYPTPVISKVREIISGNTITENTGFKNLGELLEYAASKNISKKQLKITI
ncbi:VirE-like protein [Dysgonomonas alginatilytica]|uniref:VirE-like protein n=1 Tax=Dysgonomonas alginatilytica TaxID=1605892 RepID=A0A2V3PSR4_9BACT|nr:PriCT-2 domain-containing protein [Dysgonomonas alginatilytica]PXV62071.1 VirE-like protein [Dysgonomonas alginatilytica]